MYIQYTMLQMVVEKWKGTGILIKPEVFKQTYCGVALFLCTYGSCLLVPSISLLMTSEKEVLLFLRKDGCKCIKLYVVYSQWVVSNSLYLCNLM